MDEKITWIKILYSDAALWGTEDPEAGGYDAKASAARFGKLIQDKLTELYPGVDIEVVHGINDRILVNSTPDHPEVPYIEQAVDQVYQEFAWMLK